MQLTVLHISLTNTKRPNMGEETQDDGKIDPNLSKSKSNGNACSSSLLWGFFSPTTLLLFL
jgi:hypothetical protein